MTTTPEADLHILELDGWWRENREKAPDSFAQDFALAVRSGQWNVANAA